MLFLITSRERVRVFIIDQGAVLDKTYDNWKEALECSRSFFNLVSRVEVSRSGVNSESIY